ncbi:MAG: hypothetical protein ACREX3_13225 [Gammaproteobacteria bacterium]
MEIERCLSADELPYFVNGAGGSWISGFGAIDAHSQLRYAEDYGAMVVDATATRITFRFVNRGGRVVDEHSLENGSRLPSLTPSL